MPPTTTTPRRLAAEGPNASGGAASIAVSQSASSSAVASPWQKKSGAQLWRRPVFEQYGLPPERSCALLPVSEDVVPIPVMRIGIAFPYMDAVLRASYEAFQEVREMARLKM